VRAAAASAHSVRACLHQPGCHFLNLSAMSLEHTALSAACLVNGSQIAPLD